MNRRRLPARIRMFAITGTVALAACSADAPSDANESEQVEAFGELFSDGFANDVDAVGDATTVAAATTLAYRVDPAIRREAAEQVADNLNRNFSLRFAMNDPERFLRSGEAAEVGNRMVEALGLPSDTVAGATVLMFGLAWELANDEALTPADQKALLSQVGKLLGDHDVSDRGDDARQREGDTRLLIAALWLEEARLRRADEQAMRELSDAVARDMQRMSGNDMRAHRITGDGLVDR